MSSAKVPGPQGKGTLGSTQIQTVLVEDEESIRRAWEEFFHERGMRLQTFDSAESFLRNFKSDGTPVEFFFDQDFESQRGVGTWLAAKVWSHPDRIATSLVTSYPSVHFVDELSSGVLDAVFPKFPVRIFGEEFFEKHILRRMEREGISSIIQESVDRLEKAAEKFERAMAKQLDRGRRAVHA
jgi:FixJ family two-component response regulator